MARLQTDYRETVVPQLMQQFGYKSIMQVPKIVQMTLNMGLGEAVGDKKVIERAVADMTAIAGQKPVVTKARKSVSNFKIAHQHCHSTYSRFSWFQCQSL